jgi:1,4-dihydroxy-2-naphthoate polyprenyltransferase
MNHSQSNVSIWLAQTRANFLLLAVFLVAIGLAFAAKYQPAEPFHVFHAILILLGTVSAHISVNLFNEYSDFLTRIDMHTQATPFSGGSKMLVSGKTTSRSVMIASVVSLLFALAVGLYFSLVSHWSIAVISLFGALVIMFYTPILARLMLGEFFAGLTLGALVVIGAFIAMTAKPGMSLSELLPPEVWLMSIPPGILTALLLLLNEFPDVEADKAGGRMHLVIRFGKKKAAWIYVAGVVLAFGMILILPLADITSKWMFLALLPLPIAIKAAITAVKEGNNTQKLVPALGMNVIVVLATDLLIAVAVLVQLL